MPIDIKNKIWEWIQWIVYGIVIGVVVGLFDVIFGKGLHLVSNIREQYMMWLLPFLAPVGVLLVWSLDRFGGSSKQGMGLVFRVAHGVEREIPFRLIPFVTIGTWLTHLFGGSAGREGVAVQIGATCSHMVEKLTRNEENKERTKLFLVAGMAAGFSGLFGTPFAALLFGLEVLVVGAIHYEALFLTFSASFVANYVTKLCGLEHFSYPLNLSIELDWKLFFIMIVLGVVFGMVGGSFAFLLKKVKYILPTLRGMKDAKYRIFYGGLLLSVCLFLLDRGRYSGLGTNLIHFAFYENSQLHSYDWLLKLLFTVLTLALGYLGGEVTPLFSIGASIGGILAPLVGIPVVFGAALGYVGVFCGATNTFFAPIFIGGEIFGFEYLPYFFIICVIGKIISGTNTIYGEQK